MSYAEIARVAKQNTERWGDKELGELRKQSPVGQTSGLAVDACSVGVSSPAPEAPRTGRPEA